MAEFNSQEEAYGFQEEEIDWFSMDRDSRASNYCSNTEYLILPYVIYHYIGHPVNMLFPSTQNLTIFPCKGVYFHENYFVEVTESDDGEGFLAEIITPRIADLSKVTYSPKFISKRLLTKNKYFGYWFIDNPDFVQYSFTFNLMKRMGTVEPNADWLNDYVTLINGDSINKKSIHSNVPLNRKDNRQLDSFFTYVNETINDDDSVIRQYLSNEIEMPDEIHRMISKWEAKKGVQKGAKGKGKPKGKGKGYSKGKNFYYQTSKGKGYNSYSQPNIIDEKISKILAVVDNPCFVIEDEAIYKIDDEKNITKLSITNSDKDELQKDLEILLGVIKGKIRSCSMNSSKPSKVDEDEHKKPKPSKNSSKPSGSRRRIMVVDDGSDD